ncbi:MAG: serine/threonine protein kinase [Acidobacteria bacterium]|nr:serine/threonine protein kinase [Acidobacteriota bacterium]
MSEFTHLEDLFAEALLLPEGEREAFAAAHCADSAMREELLGMLAARRRMGSFLEGSMLDFGGQTFGAYRAMEEIGRGGMSVVYRGQRVDGDFDKRVAIKVILVQTGAAPEARLLAALEHPNIARLLDSGVTAVGFRYLVMEYVEGVPCTAYAAAATEREKLQLFLQVCHGVQAAHQSLIVHRDLKPDNIVVTVEGSVKLLDFGIAKLLAPSGTQTVGPRAFTIDYASPEQILGYPASTANDVYSLGVLLCELVGGRLPRQLAELPVDEVVRRLEGAADVPLNGDLGVIARKALRFQASERYESAGALARDVERYLAGEPIEARRPTFRYRAARFVSRHRYAVAAGVVVALALAGTAGYALRQARLAETRFEQVRSLAGSVMFELHDAVQPLGNSLPARQLIVKRSLEYLDALAADASASDAVVLDTARGYLRLAEIQGKDGESASLGQTAEALERGKQGVALARRVAARSPGLREGRLVLSEALNTVASAHVLMGKPEEAIAAAREGLALAEGLMKEAPGDARAKALVAEQCLIAGDALGDAKQPKEAIAMLERSAKLYGELLAAAPGNRMYEMNLARAHNFACTLNVTSGNKEEGRRHNRAALEHSRRLYERDAKRNRAMYASDLGVSAFFESDAQRFEKAVEIYEEQLRLRREMLTENPQDNATAIRVGATLSRICFQATKAGKLEKAIRAGEDAVTLLRVIRAKDPSNAMAVTETAYGLTDLGMAYAKANRKDKACVLGKEAVVLLEQRSRNAMASYTRLKDKAKELEGMCAVR